jgi:hypothetical protein
MGLDDGSDDSFAVFGMFREVKDMEVAVEALEAAGVGRGNISALLPDKPAEGKRDFAYALRMKICLGAAIGAVIGAAIGVTIVMAVVLGPDGPTHSPHFIVKTIWLALAGTGVGTLFGAACGALVGIGTPEGAGERYHTYVQQGGTLLSIHLQDPSRSRRIMGILELAGADDITVSHESKTWGRVLYNSALLKHHHWLHPSRVEPLAARLAGS